MNSVFVGFGWTPRLWRSVGSLAVHITTLDAYEYDSEECTGRQQYQRREDWYTCGCDELGSEESHRYKPDDVKLVQWRDQEDDGDEPPEERLHGCSPLKALSPSGISTAAVCKRQGKVGHCRPGNPTNYYYYTGHIQHLARLSIALTRGANKCSAAGSIALGGICGPLLMNVRTNWGRAVNAGAAMQQDRLRKPVEALQRLQADSRELLLERSPFVGWTVRWVVPRKMAHFEPFGSIKGDYVWGAEVEPGVVCNLFWVHQADEAAKSLIDNSLHPANHFRGRLFGQRASASSEDRMVTKRTMSDR